MAGINGFGNSNFNNYNYNNNLRKKSQNNNLGKNNLNTPNLNLNGSQSDGFVPSNKSGFGKLDNIVINDSLIKGDDTKTMKKSSISDWVMNGVGLFLGWAGGLISIKYSTVKDMDAKDCAALGNEYMNDPWSN